MPYYNKVILVGRLTRDPETRMTTTGSAVASFTLAVDRPVRPSEGQRTTDFIRIVAFNKLADFVRLYLKKGQLVLVEGELRINKWQSRDGANMTTPEIWARDIRFMEKKVQWKKPLRRSRSRSKNRSSIPTIFLVRRKNWTAKTKINHRSEEVSVWTSRREEERRRSRSVGSAK